MIELSTLSKTWILDVDGTIVKHNGYLYGGDILLDGVKRFFDSLAPDDTVILLTARDEQYRFVLEQFLKEQGLRYNYLICNIPLGERILINDEKPSGLKTAYAISKKRDAKFLINYTISEII